MVCDVYRNVVCILLPAILNISGFNNFSLILHQQFFARSAGISLTGPAEDPKVASWLLDPGAKERNLHQLVGQYLPEEAPLLEGDICDVRIKNSFPVGVTSHFQQSAF